MAVLTAAAAIIMTLFTVANASPELLRSVCHDKKANLNFALCLKVLQSHPETAAAPNLVSLAVPVIELGIANATATRSYITRALAGRKPARAALKECANWYDASIGSFKSALSEVRDKEYQTANYDVMIAADDVSYCDKRLAGDKVRDAVISAGSGYVRLFSEIADVVTARLWDQNPPSTVA